MPSVVVPLEDHDGREPLCDSNLIPESPNGHDNEWKERNGHDLILSGLQPSASSEQENVQVELVTDALENGEVTLGDIAADLDKVSQATGQEQDANLRVEGVADEYGLTEQEYDVAAWHIIGAFFRETGLVRQQLDSFDEFALSGIEKVIKEARPIVVTQEVKHKKGILEHPNIHTYKFGEVYMASVPLTWEIEDGKRQLIPSECRLRNMTYSSPLYVDIVETIEGPKRHREVKKHKDVYIGKIPIMVRSQFCCLRGRSDGELATLGECQLDPGGYFVVNGSEKVIVAQERLVVNNIRVFKSKEQKYEYAAEIRSIAEDSTRLPAFLQLKMQKRNRQVLGMATIGHPIVVTLPNVKQPIPIVVLFRALGCETDRDILEHIVLDDLSPEVEMTEKVAEVIKWMEPSLNEALPIQYEGVALNFIGNRAVKPGVSKEERIAFARELIRSSVFPHMGTSDAATRNKVFFLGYMVSRLLAVALGRRDVDDRDHYGNKRLDLAGPLLLGQFRKCFYKMCKELRLSAQKFVDRKKDFDMRSLIRSVTITDGMLYFLSTGNRGAPGIPGSGSSSGVAQVLNRLTYVATLSHLRRVNTSINQEARVAAPRLLHNSQWGVMCPAETPEGMACGLSKNLSLMSYITVGTPTKAVRTILERWDMRELLVIQPSEVKSATKILVNGTWVGIYRKPEDFVSFFRKLRREMQIESEISITQDFANREIRISTDAGRLCRPLLVVDTENSSKCLKFNKLELALLTDREQVVEYGWTHLVANGRVEYIDVDEEGTIMCAMHPRDLTRNRKYCSTYTHCEIHPSMILGVCASIIPFPDHNQSPRNTYQSAMGKQALGVYATNFETRLDSEAQILYYPQRPLVETGSMKHLRFRDMPAGINCVVAIASYTGYNQEDSVILNQSSVQRGMFRHTLYKSYTAKEGTSTYRRYQEAIEYPDPEECEEAHKDMFLKLDIDGIVEPGTRVSGSDVIVGMTTVMGDKHWQDGEVVEEAKRKRNTSMKLKSTETGIVDQVLVSTTIDGFRFCKVRTRSVRTPVMGDKFASRHGQKGTCGILYPTEVVTDFETFQDMPFTAEGITPDIIINPHAIPSRMTIGHLLECLQGKVSALGGFYGDGTPFDVNELQQMAAALHAHTYHKHGSEIMYNGFTGTKLSSQIYIGPTYYQRLKHLVENKMYSRSRGAVSVLVRQPQAGRMMGGGLRFGEMERDCLISHGAALNLRERLFEVSDATRLHICDTCGLIASANLRTGNMHCNGCDRKIGISQVTIPYACKLLFQELMSVGVAPRMMLS